MRVAVCDDNSIDRDIARELLHSCFSDLGVNAELVPYSNGNVLCDDIVDGSWFDIVILDIYLENHLGIDVARRLRRSGYEGEIVFLTATADFAVSGYDVSAAGYILKPVDKDKLCDVLSRVTRSIKEGTYAIRRRSGMVRVPLGEILYVESSNSKCVLHRTDGSTYNVYKKLDEIGTELGDRRFLRCAQSYIVNMDHIAEATKSFRLDNGETVLIRQKSLKTIQDEYFRYAGSAGGGVIAVD